MSQILFWWSLSVRHSLWITEIRTIPNIFQKHKVLGSIDDKSPLTTDVFSYFRDFKQTLFHTIWSTLWCHKYSSGRYLLKMMTYQIFASQTFSVDQRNLDNSQYFIQKHHLLESFGGKTALKDVIWRYFWYSKPICLSRFDQENDVTIKSFPGGPETPQKHTLKKKLPYNISCPDLRWGQISRDFYTFLRKI